MLIFFKVITPICLPKHDFEDSKSGDIVLAVGFGQNNSSSGHIACIKQQVKLHIRVSSLCSKPNRIITKNQLCAGGEIRKNTCSGDSGGALSTLRDVNWILDTMQQCLKTKWKD